LNFECADAFLQRRALHRTLAFALVDEPGNLFLTAGTQRAENFEIPARKES